MNITAIDNQATAREQGDVRAFAFGDQGTTEVKGPLRLNPDIQVERKKADDTEGGDLD